MNSEQAIDDKLCNIQEKLESFNDKLKYCLDIQEKILEKLQLLDILLSDFINIMQQHAPDSISSNKNEVQR